MYIYIYICMCVCIYIYIYQGCQQFQKIKYPDFSLTFEINSLTIEKIILFYTVWIC